MSEKNPVRIKALGDLGIAHDQHLPLKGNLDINTIVSDEPTKEEATKENPKPR